MPSGWKAITAKVPSLDQMIKPFQDEMDHYLDLVEKDFQKTTSTWRHKPAFERTNEQRGGAVSTSIVGTYATEDEVYGYLNNGTMVRYATMSQDFVAKTRPGRIKSGPGAGGVAYVSRSRPRPGIKARKWDEVIAKGKQRNFELAFKKAVDKAIKISGHKI